MTNQQQLQEEKIQAELLRRIEKLSYAQQIAIIRVAPAFRFGCNWGFALKDEESFKEDVEALAKESTIQGFRARNGFILSADTGYIANVVGAVLPNFVNPNFLQQVQERKQKEIEALHRHVTRAVTKFEGKQVEVRQQVIHLALAIYSVNETNSLQTRGRDYPAFKLNIAEALVAAQEAAAKHRKTLYVELRDQQGNKLYAYNAVLQQKGTQAYADILSNCYISDTMTGVIIKIAFR